jgi:hypothetical protein
MKKGHLTRRTFLGIATSAGLATALSGGCPPPGKGVIVYRRSGRGCHVSNAAKMHNANHLYATHLAATLNPAHLGDHSKVVEVTISRAWYDKLFANGKLIADLRHDL